MTLPDLPAYLQARQRRTPSPDQRPQLETELKSSRNCGSVMSTADMAPP